MLIPLHGGLLVVLVTIVIIVIVVDRRWRSGGSMILIVVLGRSGMYFCSGSGWSIVILSTCDTGIGIVIAIGS